MKFKYSDIKFINRDYNMKLTTYISILDIIESKIFKYTKSAFFWLSFSSLIFVDIMHHLTLKYTN